MDGGGGSGSAAPSAASVASLTSAATVKYVCGDCKEKSSIKFGDPIKCHNCGHRILYKTHTKERIQYVAR
eukprot:EC795819.1.p3 GENE.EC795819.1~~EC795819.1.p3  ORF type:complete len:70 (+),score=19.93 EC795819.1:41-250(+)